jgi:NTP pyrophosphatase (non-canonical NTP hydrolase)
MGVGNEIAQEFMAEYYRAREKFAPFNSAHEGYAVIKEELDELWDAIKKKQHQQNPELMRKEAIQVGAMALAFILDLNLS